MLLFHGVLQCLLLEETWPDDMPWHRIERLKLKDVDFGVHVTGVRVLFCVLFLRFAPLVVSAP